MDRVGFNKRDLLRAAAVIPAGFFGARIMAQDVRLLGIKLPREVLDAIPRKPLNYLRIADAVIQLEREADRKGLPQSPLSLGKGQSLADLQDSLYQLALPRLVALIDRSEIIDAGFADKAGQLLAELHQSQHNTPEALRMSPMGLDTGTSILDQRSSIVTQSNGIFGPPPISAEVAENLPDVDISAPDAPAEVPEPAASVPEPNTASPEPVAEEEPDKPMSRARDYASLKSEYGRMYRKLEVRPQHADSAGWHVEMMRKSRARYERVGVQTGVPWHFIAVTHGLEASFNFRAHLHNGDFPLSARTRQVPAGRPSVWLPPSDWESSARDALRLLGFTGQKDWSLERTLYRLEAYNGLGYRGVGVPTPYLWSFSNQYDRGKFVSDGKFSRTAKSQQCGAAVMLKLLADAGEIKLEPAA
jgi:lysozyme family protein